MTKKEMISAVAEKTGVSKTQVAEVFEGLTETITEALVKGDRVALPPLGTFTTGQRAARQGRNPATGEVIEIKASTVVKFKPAKQVKDALN